MRRRSVLVMAAALAACGPAPEPPREDETPEAAARLVARYYALVESGEVREAAGLRLDRMTEDLRPLDTMHAEIGRPGPLRRKGGLARVSVPVAIHGRLTAGGDYLRGGAVTLVRREGGGDLEARERRWRIEAIALEP